MKKAKDASPKPKQNDERKKEKESRKDKGKEKRGREEEKIPRQKKQKQSSPKREVSVGSESQSQSRKKQKQSSPEREVSKGSRGKKRKATKDKDEKAGSHKALHKAESKLAVNSNSHHTEWLRFKRWVANRRRFPAALASRVADEDGRKKLFADYVAAQGDPEEILLRHEQQLKEQQRSQIRYGFRGEKWVRDTHGDVKGEKIMERKKSQGLTPD